MNWLVVRLSAPRTALIHHSTGISTPISTFISQPVIFQPCLRLPVQHSCPQRKRIYKSVNSKIYMRQTIDKQGMEYITLESFIKLQGLAETGGQAKMMIQAGSVHVNGTVETRRGKKLRQGDIVLIQGEKNGITVQFD